MQKLNGRIKQNKKLHGNVRNSIIYVEPSGEIEITENGKYDVTNYSDANVNIDDSEFVEKYFDTNGVNNDSNSNVSSALKQIIKEMPLIDVTKRVTLYGFFENCINMINPNTNFWNTSNVNTMSDMFGNCTKLEYINLSSFNFEKVTSLARMFTLCGNLKEIEMPSNIQINNNNINLSQMFYTCYNLKKK